MSTNDFPVLDGIVPSWADIIVRVSPAGAPLIEMGDIKSINTGTTVEIGEQQGASGGRVLKRTTGSAKNEMSWTLYRDGFQKFLRGIKALAPIRGNQRRLRLVHFGVQVQHTPPGSIEIFEYRCKGVCYLGRDMNSAEGTDADTVDCRLSVIEIADMIDGEECVLV
jgi:hypothetical protein